jgi:hypothetical protein
MQELSLSGSVELAGNGILDASSSAYVSESDSECSFDAGEAEEREFGWEENGTSFFRTPQRSPRERSLSGSGSLLRGSGGKGLSGSGGVREAGGGQEGCVSVSWSEQIFSRIDAETFQRAFAEHSAQHQMILLRGAHCICRCWEGMFSQDQVRELTRKGIRRGDRGFSRPQRSSHIACRRTWCWRRWKIESSRASLLSRPQQSFFWTAMVGAC